MSGMSEKSMVCNEIVRWELDQLVMESGRVGCPALRRMLKNDCLQFLKEVMDMRGDGVLYEAAGDPEMLKKYVLERLSKKNFKILGFYSSF